MDDSTSGDSSTRKVLPGLPLAHHASVAFPVAPCLVFTCICITVDGRLWRDPTVEGYLVQAGHAPARISYEGLPTCRLCRQTVVGLASCWSSTCVSMFSSDWWRALWGVERCPQIDIESQCDIDGTGQSTERTSLLSSSAAPQRVNPWFMILYLLCVFLCLACLAGPLFPVRNSDTQTKVLLVLDCIHGITLVLLHPAMDNVEYFVVSISDDCDIQSVRRICASMAPLKCLLKVTSAFITTGLTVERSGWPWSWAWASSTLFFGIYGFFSKALYAPIASRTSGRKRQRERQLYDPFLVLDCLGKANLYREKHGEECSAANLVGAEALWKAQRYDALYEAATRPGSPYDLGMMLAREATGPTFDKHDAPNDNLQDDESHCSL